MVPAVGQGTEGENASARHLKEALYIERVLANNSVVISRSVDERNANPERILLDGRGLHKVPILHGEDRLRLLNLQKNYISTIENLKGMDSLIFLDLYNNNIQATSGLEHCTTLRILMLGKNKIEKIEGLSGLTRLDVLDLQVAPARPHARAFGLETLCAVRLLGLDGLEGR